MLIDFNERPGFSINVGFLRVKKLHCSIFKTITFVTIKCSETLIYSFEHLICDFILNLWRLWQVLLKELYSKFCCFSLLPGWWIGGFPFFTWKFPISITCTFWVNTSSLLPMFSWWSYGKYWAMFFNCKRTIRE